jgi:hypothetical protein
MNACQFRFSITDKEIVGPIMTRDCISNSQLLTIKCHLTIVLARWLESASRLSMIDCGSVNEFLNHFSNGRSES